jgi:hypothetical protein
MASNVLNLTISGDQKLTVESAKNKTGDGYDVTSTFGGVTISGGVKDGGKPAGAGWHNGPVWLDLTFKSIQENTLIVLQMSGIATTPNGAKQIANFTVLANAVSYSGITG